ncbi:Transposase DDE domain protein [Roseimaritima multifibrata]|uniref:Transposase DDE domain protein n=1 Tax=Roseimaritima multifibrata TaxID=1930274 RepID=A0A517MA92_9BACT|nr:IS4 family transposase [Roseimaritima multifibrata]QDS91803.1 Transposase DDE domain protein [Roseimaritima multifibrata]
MCYQSFDSFRNRVHHARQCGDLYFASLLSKETIASAFGEATSILDAARVYNTSVTLWVFLSQVMSIHHGCVSAVTKLITYRVANRQRSCSAQTGAYCIARDKLDESAMHRLVTSSGQAIEAKAPNHWLWLGHRVITADGATVTMANTRDNQAEYPQLSSQAPGCGFPILRGVVLFALSTGVVLEMATGRYKGKLTHEVSLFRQIDQIIEETDVFLADRAYAGWFEMARVMQRDGHVVVRKHPMRRSDFRTGIRYGKDDHSIQIAKPLRPAWMSVEEYKTYPDFITIREIKIRIANTGFRTREIIVHTSLLDDTNYTKEDIATLFRRRWQAELNLRSLKTIMQMEHLRCKKPHRVRNEIRAHMLAYNLIRGVMAEVAIEGDVQPWQISFKSTLTTVSDMLPVLGLISNVDELCEVLYRCCLQHVVGNRPDRYEPRVLKRRPKIMQKPRHDYKPGEA